MHSQEIREWRHSQKQKDDASSQARLLLARGDYYLFSIWDRGTMPEILCYRLFESIDAGGIRIGNVESLSNTHVGGYRKRISRTSIPVTGSVHLR
jgi:hypothetical protein